MRTKNLYIIAVMAFAMISLPWTQVRAQQKMGMQGMHKMMDKKDDSMCSMMNGGHMQGFFLNQAEALELSESQIEQLQNIKTATQKAVIQKEADLKIAKLELDELMRDSNAKRSALEARAKKVEELKSNIRLTEFKAKLDARSVLTSEQLKKVKSIKKSGMQGMMQMHSKGEKGNCSMMKDSGNQPNGNDGMSEHEKHHPNKG